MLELNDGTKPELTKTRTAKGSDLKCKLSYVSVDGSDIKLQTLEEGAIEDYNDQASLLNAINAIRTYSTLSRGIRMGVVEMISILDSPNSDSEEKAAAIGTIFEALRASSSPVHKLICPSCKSGV